MKESKEKIAYISRQFPHITETFTYNEVMGLKKEGLNVQVYSFKKPDTKNLTAEMKKEIKNTIYFPGFFVPDIYLSQIYFISHIPIRYFHTMFKVIFGSYQRFSTFKLRLHNIVNFLRGTHLAFLLKDESKATHIHCQHSSNTTTAGFICNSLLNITFSFRSHTNYNSLIIKDKVKKAKFIFSISKYDKKELLFWTQESYTDKIHINYLGVETDDWQKSDQKENNNLIVSVGTLEEKKGFKYLIEAGVILKERNLDFYIKIYGDGPLRNELENSIKNRKLNDNIKIMDYISHKEVKQVIGNSLIFCLPCIETIDGNKDGIPIVLMEAMALSKPVISTDVSGIPELIDNRINGILIPEKDPLALANTLEKLLKNLKLRGSLGKAARKKIERDFSSKKNIRITADIFRRYIGSKE
jgi:colanic acid/amylovoran biosynthesis glycosyltransferase